MVGSILEGPGKIKNDCAPSGSTFQTVREYLDVVGRNAYSLMAAGAVVQPQTQLLISLLSERGDEMDVGQMRKLILRLGGELGAAQGLAGVTGEDFRRVEAECATAAGLAQVERRVDAVNKMMFDASANVQRGVEESKKKKTLNKRLRKKQRREADAMAAAVTVDAAAVEAVAATENATGNPMVTDVGDTMVGEDAVATTLAAVLAEVVRTEAAVSCSYGDNG